jgi:DNA-binding PadR family transcriptional regulator
MSVTRLLVLGAVRIFQPAHGYLVRRELLSWQADEWAHLNPGSVYNALRTLTRDGLLEELPTDGGADGARQGSGPPARASYRLTADGEGEFLGLLRSALWQLHPFEPGRLTAAISFWNALTRAEVLDALGARRAQLEAGLPMLDHLADAARTALGKPDRIQEHFRLSQSLLRGELDWVEAVTERIRAGAYTFAGEATLPD